MDELPDPTCVDCKAFYGAAQDTVGNTIGLCRRRPELGDVPASMNYCYLFAVTVGKVGLVKAVAPIAPTKRMRRPRAIEDASPQRQIATLEDPTLGDTEGEITMDRDGLKQVLREILEEETMYGFPQMGSKWEDGVLLMKPADPSLAPKEMPIESFFHKIVMVRDKLRVLEAKINGNKTMGEQEKVELQGYISKCYGSLTTFNALFKDKADQFRSK